MPKALVYIHGFLSSPLSIKAQQTGSYLKSTRSAVHYSVPSLPNYPGEAMHILEAEVATLKQQFDQIALIGSSLGGFFASYLAEKHDLKAVLINPSVRPYNLIDKFKGENTNPYTHETFTLNSGHVDELRAMEVNPSAQRYWLLSQTEDEVLDYREGVDWYADARQTVESGGDHSFINYDRHLPEIIKFLHLSE